jgi:uncharacterized OB-fold protein
MSNAEKAIPVATEEDRPYWDGARERKLVLQRCSNCGLYNAQPRVICPSCHGDVFAWTQVSGRGTIHSYCIVWQTTARGFRDEIPYVICRALIDEDASCYVTANLLVPESEYEKLTIDLPVIIDFEDRGEAIVPQWRLA